MTSQLDDHAAGTQKPGVAFLHTYFPWGGAERATMDILNYLSKHGYGTHVLACTFFKDLFPTDAPTDFEVHMLPDTHLQRSVKDATAIVDYIRRHNIKVIFSLFFLKHIDYIRKHTGVKYVYTLHGEPFCESYIVATSKCVKDTLADKLKWYLFRYPKIHWFHYYDRKFRKRYKKILRAADCYVTLCEDYKREIIDGTRLPEEEHHKIRAIGNSEHPRENVRLEKKRQVIYVGRLTYAEKRVDRLIDIWRDVYKDAPDWELLIIGDGEERAKLEALAADLPGVRFVGAVSNVQPYYDEAAILCLTSASESWGLALTEAQANGVIPISYECSSGVRHVLGPTGVNGILVPPGDRPRFVKELLALIKDPERRRKMQKNVLAKSREYSMENVGREWLRLITDLTESEQN